MNHEDDEFYQECLKVKKSLRKCFIENNLNEICICAVFTTMLVDLSRHLKISKPTLLQRILDYWEDVEKET